MVIVFVHFKCLFIHLIIKHYKKAMMGYIVAFDIYIYCLIL